MTPRTNAIARFICGRKTKWLILAAWLVVFVALGPLGNKLAGAQKNDTAQWLPSKAESTQAFDLQKKFQSVDAYPAVIVYERTSGTTPADREKVQADATKLASADGVAGQVIGPIAAQDGQALQLIVPVAMGADDQPKVGDRADAIRALATKDSNGLAVHLTGPIGFAADNNEAFLGIDSVLLLTTVAVVIVLLLLIYRSPVLWLLPVVSAGIALAAAQAVIYLLTRATDLTVTGQSAGIMTVLVFGASTDYALLLIARYREGLRTHEDKHEAMAAALHRSGPAVIASAATVVAAMLCLLLADMTSTKGLGPVVAVAIAVGLLAMITLLPALLVIFGRWLFWPLTPRYGSTERGAHGMWVRLGHSIARRRRPVWIVTALILGAMALGLTQLEAKGLSFEESFTGKPDSVVGQEAVARHFPAGQGQPVVVIGNATATTQLQQALAGTNGIAAVSEPVANNGLVYLEGTLTADPGSAAANSTVLRARDAVHAVAGADAKVGGITAMNLDMSRANRHDNRLIIPLVLLVVLLILALLLRAIVAPLVLIATVVLSFGAALGASALVFKYVFGFNSSDSELPLDVFVFLVALGIDYNIFLVTRIKEESQQVGTRRGALTGLAVTGGVITSAGLVLAATFAVLGSLPLVSFAQLGFAIALGIILDTFVVRSVLVTALIVDLGRLVWWPGKLSRQPDVPATEPDPAGVGQLVS